MHAMFVLWGFHQLRWPSLAENMMTYKSSKSSPINDDDPNQEEQASYDS